VVIFTDILTLRHELPDYQFFRKSLSCPDYGTTVRWRDQWSFDQLKTILLKVLGILKSMEPFCHMDVRLPNVIVNVEPPNLIKDVHLIDFDYSRKWKNNNPMSRTNLSYAKEFVVHANTDMWSLGVMTLRLISKVGITFDNYQEVLRDSSKWKPEFESHFDDLSEFISPCLETDPNVRLSIENGIQMLGKWPIIPLF
jgi:serine/threonine protein kinase